jgi:protein gp37
MATTSKLEWTERTWNPITGCTKISPGCKHCYAETMALRLKAMGVPGYENGFAVSLHPGRLEQPLTRKARTIYFVNSMSDLFHEAIPDEYINKVFDVIRETPHHTYQILTKRSSRLPVYFSGRHCPPNVWLGVSVEDRRYGLPRIADLRRVGASVRFLSIEPLLEDLGEMDLTGIHWVIVGGESGPKARPMRPEWVENVKKYADDAGVKFFFKQWGAWGDDGRLRNKAANGRLFKGRTWDAMPKPSGVVEDMFGDLTSHSYGLG